MEARGIFFKGKGTKKCLHFLNETCFQNLLYFFQRNNKKLGMLKFEEKVTIFVSKLEFVNLKEDSSEDVCGQFIFIFLFFHFQF